MPPSRDDDNSSDVRIARRDIAEWAFRLFVLVVTVLAVPHFAWVWQADRRLNAMEQRVEGQIMNITRLEALVEQAREKSQEQGANILLMQRDLAYLREGIDDLRGRIPARPAR